ncbi:TetR/AcrR family transcriptional regulator [Nocardioides sp. NPDC006303]|uniref:TetR/AcrR family transcriptional regulator n=1 Tax=Nocardioides sp. NPDC006303 TaxID=3156747 RepID=UPI0033B5CC57
MNQLASGSTARDRILSTASHLFYAHGVRAVGVDKVIEDAGVAKATLYSHFRSKNDLIAAYLRTRAEMARADLERIEADNDPGLRRIAALFDHVAATADEPDYNGCCFINAAAEHLDPSSGVAEIIADHRKTVFDFFSRNLPNLDESRRTQTTQVLMALLDGAKIASVSEGRTTVEQIRRAAEAWAADAATVTSAGG